MKNNLSKHYDKFTNKERVDLSLAALARGDYEEIEELCNGYKKADYIKSDINYPTKMTRLMLTSFWYKLSCAEYGLELSEKRAARTTVKSEIDGYLKGIRDAIGDITFDDEETTENHPAMLKAEKYGTKCRKKMLEIEKDIYKTVAKIVAIQKALKLVCEEQEICFNDLILFCVFNGESNTDA